MPEVSHSELMQSKSVAKLRSYRFDSLAEIAAAVEQCLREGRRYLAVAFRGNHQNDSPLSKQWLSFLVDKALVGGDKTKTAFTALQEFLGVIDIMRSCIQKRTVSDHSAQGNPKADFESVISQLLCGTVAHIGAVTETFETKATGESSHAVKMCFHLRVGQGINDLQGSLVLSTLAHDAFGYGLFSVLILL